MGVIRILSVASLVLVLSPAGLFAGEGEAPAAPAREEGTAPIVASVNGEIITLYDVDFELGRAPETLRGTEEERRRQLEILRKQAIQRLCMDEIMVQAAKRMGIRVVDSMVREELREAAKKAGGEASYFRLISDRGLSYSENWLRVERDIYVREFQRRLVSSRSRTQFIYPVFQEISVTPREMREVYRRNPKDFEVEEPGLFRLIRIRQEDAGSWKAAAEMGDRFRSEILEAPDAAGRAAAFARLAGAHSSHETAKDGGAMALTDTPTLAVELHKELLRLEPGQVSETINTEFGVFLLFLERPKTRSVLPFEEVQKEIRNRIHNEKWRAHLRIEEERLLELARVSPEEIARLLREPAR